MSEDFAQPVAEPDSASGQERWRTILLVVTAALGAAVLAALVVTMGEATRQRDRALAAQSHSYDVMILARTLSGTIARAEAGARPVCDLGDRDLGGYIPPTGPWPATRSPGLPRSPPTMPTINRASRIFALPIANAAPNSTPTALSTRYHKNDQALARYYQARSAPALALIDKQLDAIIARERDHIGTRTARRWPAWIARTRA